MIWSLKAETMRELIITLEEGLRFIWKMDGMTGIQAAVLAEVMPYSSWREQQRQQRQ